MAAADACTIGHRQCSNVKKRPVLPALVRIDHIPFVRNIRFVPDPFRAEVVIKEHAGNRNLCKRLSILVQTAKTIVAYFLRIEFAAVVALAAIVTNLISV